MYGRPDFLPVSEQHLVKPTDVNGINKVAGEYYHLVYNNVFGVRACSLRLTNVYGPRQLIKHNRQGFIGWFIRQAIEGARDSDLRRRHAVARLRFVDDAVDAFLRAGVNDACNGEVFNVGGGQPISHRALVTMLLEVAGHGQHDVSSSGRRTRRPSTSAASTRRRPSSRRSTGWQPAVALRDGLARTIEFYRAHFGRYVPGEPALQVGYDSSPCGFRSWSSAWPRTGRGRMRPSAA